MARPSFQAKRLLKLADFLEDIPRKHFDMGQYASKDPNGKGKFKCGTTACALGWATQIPAFRKLGFKMNSKGHPVFADQDGNRFFCLEAGEEFFAIDSYETSKLFSGDDEAYATPKQVAKGIRKFVKEKLEVDERERMEMS
jgi:hypothetical protein